MDVRPGVDVDPIDAVELAPSRHYLVKQKIKERFSQNLANLYVMERIPEIVDQRLRYDGSASNGKNPYN